MQNLFLLYGTLIAFFGLFLISNMSVFFHFPNALRLVASIILLPAALSAAFLFNLTQESLIITGKNINLIPLDLGLVVSNVSALLMVACTLSLIFTLFLMPSHRLVATIKPLALCFFLLLLVSLPINWFVAAALFSLGSLVISYSFIRESERNGIDEDISEVFLWHRLSDIFLFLSLVLILIQQQTLSLLLLPKIAPEISPLIIILFFIALICRLIPLSQKRSIISFTDFRDSFLLDAFVSLGIIVFLFRLREIIFLHKEANYILIITSILIFIRSLLSPLTVKILIFKTANVLLTSIIIILLIYEQYYAAEALFIVLALLIPMALIIAEHREPLLRASGSTKTYFDPLEKIIIGVKTCVLFGAESAATFVGPFYGNFLFYRVPQLIIAMIEIPLRLFHNGSIQRSLFFIIVSLAFYYYWWER